MNKPSANLMVALLDQMVCIKISGRANFTASLDFKKLVTGLFQRGYGNFILDLSDCLIMDSTFLGGLAGIGLKIAEAQREGSTPLVELFNPNARISDLLENLGVAHLFNITQRQPPAAVQENYQPLPTTAEENSRVDVTRNCLEAHQFLMSLNPENVGKFKDVAQFLADDLRKLEAEDPKVRG